MPFARPETALASTIDRRTKREVVRAKTVRPAASQRPSTIFQALTRRLNDLQKGRVGERRDRLAKN
jgi:hypothetical protein